MSEAGLLADPQEVRAILVASAQAGLAISYSEVLGLPGHHFSRPKMRALCKVRSYVDDQAAAPGGPALAGLVGRTSTGVPGRGWGSRAFNRLLCVRTSRTGAPFAAPPPVSRAALKPVIASRTKRARYASPMTVTSTCISHAPSVR